MFKIFQYFARFLDPKITLYGFVLTQSQIFHGIRMNWVWPRQGPNSGHENLAEKAVFGHPRSRPTGVYRYGLEIFLALNGFR